MMLRTLLLASSCVWLASLPTDRTACADEPAKVLSGTQALVMEGDITSELVDGVDRFLLKQLAQAPEVRQQRWPRPAAGSRTDSYAEQWSSAQKPLRNQLAKIIGLRDQRTARPRVMLEHSPHSEGTYAAGDNWTASRARWQVHSDVDATGLWVQSRAPGTPKFRAVVIPDAGQTPEHLIGVAEDNRRVLPLAAYLAATGGDVLVTTPISRHREARRGRAVMTDQEYLYRSAFELGRHALGYQVQEVLSAVDALKESGSPSASNSAHVPVVVFGWGEGGWIALHAAAVSESIDAACISGHIQAREQLWQEPIHRNVQSLLKDFGDAELAALIAPRQLIVDAVPGPQVEIGGDGGAPGRLTGPTQEASRQEFKRLESILAPWNLTQSIQLVEHESLPQLEGASAEAVLACLDAIGVGVKQWEEPSVRQRPPAPVTPEERRTAMLSKWDRFSQRILEQAADERATYWKSLKTDSIDDFKSTIEPYRQAFSDEVIGRWELPLQAAQPRSRLVYDKPKYLGYEIVLDVFPDVIAYGVLLLPRDQPPGERRPCVVFQHGLEGRPQDCIEGDHPAYHDVASRLAEQGFVVFAPQNLYIFHDRFRTLQRKSNPLGKTLFSTIIPQHQQICRWLAIQPQVDPSRIAFYGLSYGGKSAMRIPPLVPEYCLSICSADFNDWVWKNASTHSSYSYVWTMEYEIFEFDLGSRFNYAEMASLIAPRPFMVERGHFDGVAPDERVALEFAKVRHLYSAKLGLKDAARLEWFVGPHTINGQGTYEFLHEKLNWP